jgi:hypothetical protein
MPAALFEKSQASRQQGAGRMNDEAVRAGYSWSTCSRTNFRIYHILAPCSA